MCIENTIMISEISWTSLRTCWESGLAWSWGCWSEFRHCLCPQGVHSLVGWIQLYTCKRITITEGTSSVSVELMIAWWMSHMTLLRLSMYWIHWGRFPWGGGFQVKCWGWGEASYTGWMRRARWGGERAYMGGFEEQLVVWLESGRKGWGVCFEIT